MTDTTRLATLEAALRDADRDLEALRQMLTKPPIENPSRAAALVTLGKARSALDRAIGIAFRLDALPADPAPAEVVEVRPIQIATHYDPGMRGYDGCGITAAYDVTTVLMSDGALWRMWGNEPDAVWVRMPRLPLTGDGA